MKQFALDRKVIENKYHNTSEPYDAYNRFDYRGYDFDPSTGMAEEDICAGLKELDQVIAHLPHPVAKAKAIKYVLDHTRIDINENDWFVGFYSIGRLANAITFWKWRNEAYAGFLSETSTLMDDMNTSGAVAIWADYDHVVPNWDDVLELGFKGLKERAARYREQHRADGTLTPEMDAHFEGIDIEYGAILDVIDRLYRLAKKQTHAKAEKTAKCLKQLRDGAPSNIYEALQANP